jgi:hypothetical protein
MNLTAILIIAELGVRVLVVLLLRGRHRQKSDYFLETACDALRLPLLRVTAPRAYGVVDLRIRPA